MATRIADTRQCPICRQWIEMPIRYARRYFELHTSSCRVVRAGVVDPPACSYCHEPIAYPMAGHTCRDGDGRPYPPVNDCGAPEPETIRQWCPEHNLWCPFKGSDHQPEDGKTYRTTMDIKRATIKRADLWGNVTDTHQTEAELNGFRATQGALL